MLDREREFAEVHVKGLKIRFIASPALPRGRGLMFDSALFAKWIASMNLVNLPDGTMTISVPPVPDDLIASAVLITDVWAGRAP